MGLRRMTAEERRAADLMARGKLTGGEKTSSVVNAIRLWLMSCGWNPKPALTQAKNVVAAMEKEIATPPKPKAAGGLYEAWRLPGSDWTEGEITASEAKRLGATIKVKGVSREFHVTCGGELHPFTYGLYENQPVGTLGAEDNLVYVDEFSTMTAARAEARIRARGGQT